MSNIKLLLVIIVGSILFFGAIWGLYTLKRWFNTEMYYNDVVQEQVCKMVKKDHLTEYGLEACSE